MTVGSGSLIASVVTAGTAAGARPVVVVGPARPGLGSVRFVSEQPPGAGPVPALRRGLSELAGPEQAGPEQAGPEQAGPEQAGPEQAGPEQAGPEQAGPEQAGPEQAGPEQAGPEQAGPEQAQPGLVVPWVAVLAADLPFLRAAHLRTLLGAASGRAGAVLADDAGRPQWLAGCWRTGRLRDAAARYHGDSLRGLFAPLEPALVRLAPAEGQPPPWLDCDTPEDLDRVRKLAGGKIHGELNTHGSSG